MDIRLDGKVAIVTGAASGIGRGIAEELADSGAAVCLADIDSTGAADAAARLAQRSGSRCLAVETDVTNKRSVAAMVQACVEGLGRVDILVNNAGIAPAYPLAEFPEAAWDRCIDVNLKGYFLCGQAVAQQLIAQGEGGGIVNISSKTGVRAAGENSAYNASKFGVIGLAQGWAQELAKYGIRVNAVLPGNVFADSHIWDDAYRRAYAAKKGIAVEHVEEFCNRLVPLGRACTVRDVAQMVVFLVSDAACYVTGCSHLVDGGQEMR